MSQPTDYILTQNELSSADYRAKFVEAMTDATDFMTADSSLLLSTVPFLPQGTSFSDYPCYPVGLTQQFSYNEGLPGQFVGEIGSARMVQPSGTATGTGMISRLAIHGNSLTAALYRPTLAWIQATDSLPTIIDRIAGTDTAWIQGLNSQSVSDIYSIDMDEYIDYVISAGGLNAVLYKIPFGLIEIKMDPRQRVAAINFLEQCYIQGMQSAMSAGQFQIMDSMSFSYERLRPLKGFSIWTLSSDEMIGLTENNTSAG